MSTQPLAIVGSGMVTGVGLTAPSSCAAIRCAVDNFQETRFMDAGGEWIVGGSVSLEEPWRGTNKLIKMLACVLTECIKIDSQLNLADTPVLLCLAEEDRPGRLPDLENRVFIGIQQELNTRFHEKSAFIAQGRVSITLALQHARQLIYQEKLPNVVIVGVDSLLAAQTLKSFEERERLLTSQNSNGFIPGEAAAAVLVQAAKGQGGLTCNGLGLGMENATVNSEDVPLRADGLVAAIRGALSEAGCDMGATDFRITDVSGEQYAFKETALALLRILRQRKVFYDLWHPADCIGEVGAAIGPVMLAVLLAAGQKSYLMGNDILAHLSNDAGKRAAMMLTYRPMGAA